ncbi:MAG TPA: AMP-binding protein [Rhodanobacteraceae bacterium]|nr:AMP-binding protein [Rhodanobacteraceae bacterium]
MSSVIEPQTATRAVERLPLLAGDLKRVFAYRDGQPVTAAVFLGEVIALAATLPEASAAVNLCEDRYAFLQAFCAVLLRGQCNLLPSTRTPAAIAETLAANPGASAIGDRALDQAPPGYVVIEHPVKAAPCTSVPMIPAAQCALVGYTSGSTGKPTANRKSWRALACSNGANRDWLAGIAGADCRIVATVPPQHMYGIETSVLLPLLGGMAVSSERPFFPADIAAALAALPAPRVLVTTPLHLRKLLDADIELPPLAAIVSATAPLTVELAQAAEAHFDTVLAEVFGSTETCVFAHRRSARDLLWHLYPGVQLHPQPDGVVVHAPQLEAAVTLADIVQLDCAGRAFRLCGRNADLLEIAGKRASLADLTARLQALPGVEDGVMLQLDPDASGVRRIAALAVAPTLTEAAVLDALRQCIDPVFLPRRLRRVAALPRNETGKLPRAALLALLR